MWVFQAVVDGWFRAAVLCCCLRPVSAWSGVRWSIAEWRRLRSHRGPVRAVASRIAWFRVEWTPRFTSSFPETALNDSAAAVPQRLPVRPTDGRIPRPAMNPVHPAHVHRAPPIRVEDRDTADRWTGPARPWPRPRRRVRRACDRRSRARRPLPRDAIHDDRRVGGSPPGRTMRDAAHPSHPGRGGGDAPASRPGRPGRSGAGTIRPGPSPRPTGNRTRCRHDPADHAE